MRRRLRRYVPVLLVAFLLPACASDPPSSGAGARAAVGPELEVTAAWTPADVEAATTLIRQDPTPVAPHWQRLVLLGYRVTGPADHLRWNAAVVGANAEPFTIESEMGDTGRLIALLEAGDYFAAHVRYGNLSADDVRLISRRAIRIGQ